MQLLGLSVDATNTAHKQQSNLGLLVVWLAVGSIENILLYIYA